MSFSNTQEHDDDAAAAVAAAAAREMEEYLSAGLQKLTVSSGGLIDDGAPPGILLHSSSNNSTAGGRSNPIQIGGHSTEKWIPSFRRGDGGGVRFSLPDRRSTEERAEGIASSLLARKMYQLSPTDRESTLHDVHGISEDFQETEELIQQAISKTLEELNKKIRENHSRDGTEDTATYINVQSRSVASGGSAVSNSSIDNNPGSSNGSTASLERALQQDASYVTDRVFLLKFLRTDRFDHVKAAKRLIKYFEEKERWFGRHLLTQKILMHHLDERALGILDMGQTQILRERDQAGRAIVISFGGLSKLRTDPLDIRAYIQGFWKLSEILMEDEMTQTKGVVFISYVTGANYQVSSAEASAAHYLHYSLPGRVVSMHACVNDAPSKAFFLLSTMLLGDHMSTRYRCHLGSHIEVQYELNTFGIPNRALPISITGVINVEEHRQFLRRLWIEEDSSSDPFMCPHSQLPFRSDSVVTGNNCNACDEASPSIDNPAEKIKKMTSCNSKSQSKPDGTGSGLVVVPGENDVLLGRGKFVLEHVGNVKYRYMLGTYKEKYETGTKSVKSNIIGEIVAKIAENGGRFLEQDHDGGLWAPVSHETARQKVSHYFRNQKRIDMKRAEKAGSATSKNQGKVRRTSPSSTKDVVRERLRDDVNYSTVNDDRQMCNFFSECFSGPNTSLFNTIDDSHHHHAAKRRRSDTKQRECASTVDDDGSLFHDIDEYSEQLPSMSPNPFQDI